MQISETALPSIPRMGDMQDTASAAAAAAAVATVAPETEVKMEGIKNENEVGDGGGDKNEDEKEEALPEDANETIYIQNLNEKVKLSVLKASLESLFSTYGRVLDIVAHKNVRMRGQAFLSFGDKKAAAKAVEEVKGFPLYGKPMQLSFAKRRSDAVVRKLDNAQYEQHKRARLDDKNERIKNGITPVKRKGRFPQKAGADSDAEDGEDAAATAAAAAPAQKKAPVQMPDEYLPPNKILFLQNVPDGVGRDGLEGLFQAYPNLVDVRTIPGKTSIAFVEYTDEGSSAVAREALNGYSFGGEEKIKITFARA